MPPESDTPRTVLAVEDNATNRKLLRVTLEAEGFTVFDAADGVEALAILRLEKIDAIISDILMPHIDGFRLCQEVRKSDELRDLPFIIYTCAYTSPSDEKLALRIGVDKYLRKPVPVKTLVAALCEVCARPRRQGQRPAQAPAESEVMKEYSEAIVRKLEETNADLARAVSYQECLAGLGQRALTNGDVAALIDEAVGRLAERLHVDSCAAWELLPDGHTLLLRAGAGFKDGMAGATTVGSDAPGPASAVLAAALRSAQPVVVNRPEAEPASCAHGGPFQHAVRGSAAVAVRGSHAAWGVLSVHAAAPREFRPEEVHFLQSVANILAAAIDRKRAEEALAAAKQSAEQANRAKDHFLAVLSHELRTPLAPVVLGLSMLRDRPDLDPMTRETLEMVRRNVELEALLIDDLLDVSRIARGKIELTRRPVELCAIIRRAVEVCKPDIEARRLHFGVDAGPAAPYWVEGDAARLQQVFWNLLKNAIKFTPHGGCVGVRCRPHGGFVSVEVNDSGIGIEPEALPRVFHAFEQADRSITLQFGGLGLGLAICKAMVETHGGQIEAHSDGRDKGATFRVRLPLCAPPAQVEEPAPAARRPHVVRPLRILLVEDHGGTAKMMRWVLTKDGHEVQAAGDVSTALELASRQPFDLLLSDVGLPDGSGHDLIRQLRERGHAIPGIALSGYGQAEDIQRSHEAGFAAHLTKPASREAVLEAIASVMATGNRRDIHE